MHLAEDLRHPPFVCGSANARQSVEDRFGRENFVIVLLLVEWELPVHVGFCVFEMDRLVAFLLYDCLQQS